MSEPIPLDPRFPQGFCPRHRLPLRPDGTCLLCGGLPGPSRRQVALIYLFACLALVGGGFLVWHMWRQMDAPARPPAREARASRSEPRFRRIARDAEVEEELEPEMRAPEARPDTRLASGPRARQWAGRWDVARATRRPRPARAATEPRPDPDPSPPVRRVVVRPVSITMYMTRWCPHCTRARGWLRNKKIPYREVNVESDKTGAAELRQLNPRGGVPTFNIDGRVLVGFSPAALATAVEMARERRAHGPASTE